MKIHRKEWTHGRQQKQEHKNRNEKNRRYSHYITSDRLFIDYIVSYIAHLVKKRRL